MILSLFLPPHSNVHSSLTFHSARLHSDFFDNTLHRNRQCIPSLNTSVSQFAPISTLPVYYGVVLAADQNVVDRYVHELDKETNTPHDQKANECSLCNHSEFLSVRFGTLFHEVDAILSKLLQWLNEHLVESFLFHTVSINLLTDVNTTQQRRVSERMITNFQTTTCRSSRVPKVRRFNGRRRSSMVF